MGPHVPLCLIPFAMLVIFAGAVLMLAVVVGTIITTNLISAAALRRRQRRVGLHVEPAPATRLPDNTLPP